MQGLIEDPELSIDARAILRFGLAAVLDAKGRYAEAAAHLEVANALQSASKAQRGLANDPDQLSTFVDRIIADVHFRLRGACSRLGEPRPSAGLRRGTAALGHHVDRASARIAPASSRCRRAPDVNRIFRALPELAGQASQRPI